MEKTLKFSVSMCVYEKDNPQWFLRAVDSIINQSSKPSEIVLVVDGPIPYELEKIISSFGSNSFFKIIRLKDNVGHGNARRIGLQNCTYELVALMDSDDISAPFRFEKQLKVFELNNNLSVVGGQITEFIDNSDIPISKRTVPLDDKDIKDFMRYRCPMNQVTVMFKKKDVEEVGGYIDWHNEEDYYLWIRLMLAGKRFQNLDDVLVNVRIGKEMYKRRGGYKYFKSEAKLHKYMYRKNVISFKVFIINILKRFIVQVILPNRLRGWIFRTYGREKYEK